ncbi:hypothetical protein DERP_006454 [Dermatophagoides pteronyssinus]|uniref:Uncharacterized protein n=1 Tax=Dermatophagoides pteronyssinus TaxID=6956 RepID=A0ABQ8IQ76_DERPT|nr:hypothetical protein DERP_006454 [Dermatophagoides pteronyssinus]
MLKYIEKTTTTTKSCHRHDKQKLRPSLHNNNDNDTIKIQNILCNYNLLQKNSPIPKFCRPCYE